MIYLSLPLLCDNKLFNNAFDRYITQFPGHLRIPFQIESIYGSFPYCSWNGGPNSNYGKDYLYKELNQFINTNDLVIRLDCSNILLDENDLQDRHENVILDLLQSKGNIIDISDLKIYSYIQETYKNYQYTLSNNANLIHPLTSEIINAFAEKEEFILITINPQDNVDLLSINHKSKLELIVGDKCKNCNKYNQCKMQEMNNQISFSGKTIYSHCPYQDNFYNTNLLFDELSQYIKLGITHFKISPPSLEEIEIFNRFLVFNLIKPEYINSCLVYIDDKIQRSLNK